MESMLQGKIALVTGATRGIGQATALALVRLGARVTIVSRSAEKCAATADQIRAATGSPVDFIAADLSTLAGIRQAAAAFLKSHDRLHVLINNAGGFFRKRILTADGYELTFALDHLNYFLLTDLLLGALKAGAPARVVSVSSGAHLGARTLDFDNLQGERRYNGWEAYARAKLCNLLFTYELARRLEGSGVTANAVHPGFVATGFARNNGFFYDVGTGLFGRLFGRRPEKGAETSIYLASAPEVEGVNGRYFADRKPVQSSTLSYNTSIAAQLWQVSQALTAQAS